ncbi:ATP-grasp domain-containing protein [Candidatus Saccharibacteria bacterium]|nr:ATP-grasp domain-containing protein [Candidatus Saccharibacteria bacterium]
MKKVLWTTEDDRSIDYFYDWEKHYYEKEHTPTEADVVYFRDPFNNLNFAPDPKALDAIITSYQGARSIDNIHSFQDIERYEDKYRQFEKYGSLMPKTWLATKRGFITGKNIAKPRISQRARNVLFELDRKIDDNWIIQERMDIKEELRIYIVFGEIQRVATIKSSKQTGKVKVIDERLLSEEEYRFSEKVAALTDLDFAGIDVAILKNGLLRLIEVNRSPQFKRYTEITGINLADEISKHL